MQTAPTRPPELTRARRIVRAALLGLCLYLVAEAFLPARLQPSAYALVGAIRVYQATLSPVVGTRVTCKFRPTCSHYGADSVARYGTLVGTCRTSARLWRCSPWGPAPGEDLP